MKIVLALALILGGLIPALILRTAGHQENLPLLGFATFTGIGMLVGAMWNDRKPRGSET